MSTKLYNSLEAEMQDVTVLHSDPPEVLQPNYIQVQHTRKDGFFDSPVAQGTKYSKQSSSRLQKGSNIEL